MGGSHLEGDLGDLEGDRGDLEGDLGDFETDPERDPEPDLVGDLERNLELIGAFCLDLTGALDGFCVAIRNCLMTSFRISSIVLPIFLKIFFFQKNHKKIDLQIKLNKSKEGIQLNEIGVWFG